MLELIIAIAAAVGVGVCLVIQAREIARLPSGVGQARLLRGANSATSKTKTMADVAAAVSCAETARIKRIPRSLAFFGGKPGLVSVSGRNRLSVALAQANPPDVESRGICLRGLGRPTSTPLSRCLTPTGSTRADKGKRRLAKARRTKTRGNAPPARALPAPPPPKRGTYPAR